MKNKKPRFEVFNGETSVITSNEVAKIAKEIVKLQHQKQPVIKIHDYENHEIIRYRKEIHQKNYRVSVKKEVQLIYKPAVQPEEVAASE